MIPALAALAVLVAVSWAFGRGVVRRGGGEPLGAKPLGGELELVIGWISGLVMLYLLLLGFDLLGLSWRLPSLAPALVALAILGWLGGRRRDAAPRGAASWQPLGWGDAAAAAAFVVFVAATALLWNLHPDFIYHWGIKGWKFYLARGLDFAWLASPEAAHAHPDYPNLVPSLFALTAILGGSYRELPMALWSALFFALTVLAARALLARLGASPFARQAGVALVGLTLAMFGVGYLQAGGGDTSIALALVAGAALLAGEPDDRTDVHLGWVAAFAAAAKIEGVALAAWLIGVHLLRRWLARGGGFVRQLPAALVRTLLPSAAAVGVWAWQVKAYGLFQPANVGAFDLGRVGVVFPELFRSLLTVNWHGLPFCLFALPLLLTVRRSRPIAAVCCLQLAFYVAVYLSAAVDPLEWVATSAARLYFHLVPAVLVLVITAADRMVQRL
jgi:hypothetical protein